MTKLSEYWKANKRNIIYNWKKSVIKEKHNYSSLDYIQSIIRHINEDCLVDYDMSTDIIARYLYSHL